jgi:hypothetical protein
MYHKRENAGTFKNISGMQTIQFLKTFLCGTNHHITPDLILDIL